MCACVGPRNTVKNKTSTCAFVCTVSTCFNLSVSENVLSSHEVRAYPEKKEPDFCRGGLVYRLQTIEKNEVQDLWPPTLTTDKLNVKWEGCLGRSSF